MAKLYAQVHEVEGEVEINSQLELESWIAQLNSKTVTMISLRRENDDSHLVVAGGPTRLIVAWDRKSEPPYLTMLTHDLPKGRVDLVAGGQLADFDPEVAVTPLEVRVAAVEFMKTGEATPMCGWREE